MPGATVAEVEHVQRRGHVLPDPGPRARLGVDVKVILTPPVYSV